MELYIFLAAILIACFGYGFVIVRRRKYINFVVNNSILLKNLKELNDKYKFYDDIADFDESHVYDNEKFYDSISCRDYLIYQLQFKKYDIEKEIKCVKYNKQNYKKYCDEVLKISKFGKYEQACNGLNDRHLLKIEKQLYEKNKLQPIIQFDLTIDLFCSKINGEIYDRKSQSFSGEEIETLISKLNNKRGTFFQDKEIWDALCRVERGKVSNKMRFSIYQRDGYRCKYCGRSESSDYLEIDHIKPIARGGKTTYDNLQTLCRRCNKNKGDSY